MIIDERTLEDICCAIMKAGDGTGKLTYWHTTLAANMLAEFQKEGRVTLEVSNATRQVRQQKEHWEKHQDRDESGQAAEASNSHCAVDSAVSQDKGKVRQEGKVIYIAGPMTGYEDFNFPAFHQASGFWRARGFTVMNPAEINTNHEGVSNGALLRRDLQALLLCDTIYMLDGWSVSAGAQMEFKLAKWLGMNIWYQTNYD